MMILRREDDDDESIPAVPYVPFRCPTCLRHKPRTYKVRGRTRYHQCMSCGVKYRSFEVGREHVTGWEGMVPPPPEA